MYQDDWLTLADKFGTSHTLTIVMPRRGTRIGITNPMLSSYTPTNLLLMSTSNSFQPSSYQVNQAWPPPSTSIPSTQYLGNMMRPGKYHLTLGTTTPSAPSTSGPRYNDYEAMMGPWHRFAADQMLRGEPVMMLYRVHHLRNAPRPIGEMREDVREEPRLPIPEARPEDHAQAKQFNNQLDQALLLVDYIQTRTCVFKLIDELEIMMEKLADIALGLEWSSMHGTY